MSPAKRYLFGGALFLGLVRVGLLLVRVNTPRSPSVIPMDPEAVSQREAEKGAQRAAIAKLLDASEIDVEDRRARDEARDDARRALRDLGREANAAGLSKLGFEAFELERGLSGFGDRDARKTCSLGALQKLDAASSALAPAARAPLEERLSLVHRHVSRACELAMLAPAP